MGVSADNEGRLLISDPHNRLRWVLNPDTDRIEIALGGDLRATVSGSAPDGKTVVDLGGTLEPPLVITSYFGGLAVSEKTGRLYAGSRDPYSPWGVFWYWDMKTGKAVGLAGPKKVDGKLVAQDGGEADKNFHCSSGPADKVSFWCTGGPSLGPDQGERYLYIPGGDESTPSRLDLKKRYVTKLVRAEPKGDRNLWTFGEGRQGRDYRFGDPYTWPGAPQWGNYGEFYMGASGRLEVFRPVLDKSVKEAEQ